MTKTLTASVLAATVALTGVTATATPAAANGHRNNGGEAAAVVGGLLLLYGLSQVGNGNGGAHVVQPHHPRPHHPRPLGGHPTPPRNLLVAPERCFVEGHGSNGPYRGFARRCMQRHVAAPYLLPQSCIRNIHRHQGSGQIYGGRCLRNHGWTRG